MKNILAAKIIARNRVNQFILDKQAAIREAMKPFVGQKVFTAQGDYTAKFRAAIAPSTASTPEIQIYRSRSVYSITYYFKTSEQVDHHSCTYEESSCYFADLDSASNVLTKILEFHPEHYRTDFTELEIQKARAEIEQLKKQLSNCQSRLCGFGEYNV